MKKAWINIKETFLEYKKIVIASFSAVLLFELLLHFAPVWFEINKPKHGKSYLEKPVVYIHTD
jgi:hypothetical protein